MYLYPKNNTNKFCNHIHIYIYVYTACIYKHSGSIARLFLHNFLFLHIIYIYTSVLYYIITHTQYVTHTNTITHKFTYIQYRKQLTYNTLLQVQNKLYVIIVPPIVSDTVAIAF
jgi:hypothetical protein